MAQRRAERDGPYDEHDDEDRPRGRPDLEGSLQRRDEEDEHHRGHRTEEPEDLDDRASTVSADRRQREEQDEGQIDQEHIVAIVAGGPFPKLRGQPSEVVTLTRSVTSENRNTWSLSAYT